MDAERFRFLFGSDAPPVDVADESALAVFFEEEIRASDEVEPDDFDGFDGFDGFDDLGDLGDVDDEDDDVALRAMLRQVVARQVLDDTPPEAWQTVVRLRDQGLGRDDILSQMTLAVIHEIRRALEEADADREPAEAETARTDHYRALLATLPVPDASDVVAALHAVVAETPGIAWDGAVEASLVRLDRAREELARRLTEAAVERALDEESLAILPPDRLVHPPTVTQGIVLTHRLNAAELELDALMCGGTDLAGFAALQELWWRGPDGTEAERTVEVFSLEAGHLGWDVTEGWLDGFVDGDLLAVRVEEGGTVRIERLSGEPDADDALVDRLRRAYDDSVDEAGLPASCADLVLAVLVDDATSFDRPQLPLTELCGRARLELRGGFVADDDELWDAQRRLQRFQRVHDTFDDHDVAHQVLDTLDTAEDADAEPDALRQALAHLADSEVCWGVLDELVDADAADAGDVAAASGFAERLLSLAHTPTERAVARFVAGVVAERSGAVEAADAHFQRGLEADDEWAPLVDRAAWYASVRGDARRAADLWNTFADPEAAELAVVEDMAGHDRVKVGRNDPCWCGSGQKLKACHREPYAPVPLTERVGWMWAKAVGYLFRHGGRARDDLFDLALGRSAGPDADDIADLDARRIVAAYRDPIVTDAALVEGGWLEWFLRDFGPLLPADEAELLASWVPVDRSVYEVEEVRPAEGVVVRDVATGERFDVREPLGLPSIEARRHVCGRAVPEDTGRRFVGTVFTVPPDRTDELGDICRRRDGYDLCAAVASIEPTLP